jgi:hypothetical protein
VAIARMQAGLLAWLDGFGCLGWFRLWRAGLGVRGRSWGWSIRAWLKVAGIVPHPAS